MKKFRLLTCLTILILSVFLISSKKEINTSIDLLSIDINYYCPDINDMLLSQQTNVFYHFPQLTKSYVGFKEALAFKESRGDYSCVNTLGYLGKYQFGVSTLETLGIFNPKEFLKDPELQETAFLLNVQRNKWVLRNDIKLFVGQYINGIKITESGILAAAHLAGPKNVKRFLRSSGTHESKDAYGTNIASYMAYFSAYDTSFISFRNFSKLAVL